MIGGENDIVQYLDPIFTTLAPGLGTASHIPGPHKPDATAEQSYLHCGPHGAGHIVKMVHNGIEYGLMAAYAEGMKTPTSSVLPGYPARAVRDGRQRARCGGPDRSGARHR